MDCRVLLLGRSDWRHCSSRDLPRSGKSDWCDAQKFKRCDHGCFQSSALDSLVQKPVTGQPFADRGLSNLLLGVWLGMRETLLQVSPP